MPNTKYKFNPETLNYEKVERDTRYIILRGFRYLGVGIVIATFGVLVALPFIKEHSTSEIKSEKDFLEKQLSELKSEIDQSNMVLSSLQKRDDNLYRVIFEAEPYPSHKRVSGTGGNPVKYEEYQGYSLSDEVIEARKQLEALQKRMVAQTESHKEIIEMYKNKEEMLASIPAIMPISDKDLTRVSSGFGMRTDPIYKTQKMHAGMDFTAPTGTDVYATGNGVVERADSELSGYGNLVVINHGYGFKTYYAHLNAFNVKKGQKIKRGSIIGFVGSTGKSTAPHLHYEVMKNNEKIDPINFFYNDLTPDEYERMIEISKGIGQSFD